MNVNFEVLESTLSETEMALLIAVNIALNASLISGADANLNVQHLKQHEDNFDIQGKEKARHIMAALQFLHKNAAGIS